jgi:hypothetical protein
MKKVFYLALLILVIIIVIIILFNDRLEKKEVAFINNQEKKEKIYFVKLSWGNDERIIISKNKKAKVSEKTSDKYVLNNGCCILYKLDKDTLYLYGNNIITPQIQNFRTPVKVIFYSTPHS